MTNRVERATVILMDEKDKERWQALGAALPKALEAVEREAAHEWREHVRYALEAANVPEEDALRRGVDTWEIDVRAPRFTAMADSLFTNVSSVAKRAHVVRMLLDIHSWIEREQFEDAWGAFWSTIQKNMPGEPEGLAEAASGLAGESRSATSEPFSTWPMELTGSTVADLIRASMKEVSMRTGVPLEELPPVPDDDTPAMTWSDAASASRDLQSWLEWRAAWGTVFGLLAKHLRPG